MSFLGERGINVEVINQISVISPTGVALPSVVFGSLTGTSAFINTALIDTLTCSDLYSSQISSSSFTGSSAYFESSLYTPQMTADNLTGGSGFFTSLISPLIGTVTGNITGNSAYFTTITGTNIYSGGVTGNITGSNGSFSSLLQIPTSTGTAVAGSIYYSPTDNKLHCYNGTGYTSVQLT